MGQNNRGENCDDLADKISLSTYIEISLNVKTTWNIHIDFDPMISKPHDFIFSNIFRIHLVINMKVCFGKLFEKSMNKHIFFRMKLTAIYKRIMRKVKN